jgi:diacylglycerol kinase family enzyme
MKWLAIFNPRAGHNGESYLKPIATQLQEKLSATCVFTARRNHTYEIVRSHPTYDGYIAIGGDGTISEVVNGMCDSHVLGIVPAGTSNGLAHDLELHCHADALRALERARFERFDVISVGFRSAGRYRRRKMISTSALGYIAGATETAYRFKRRLRLFSHFVGAIWQPFRQREFPVRLSFDDEAWDDEVVTNLAVHNTQFLGTFCLFPEARVDDGLLNVLHGRLSTFGQLMEDLGILTRRYWFARSVHRPARRLSIQLPQPATLMVDGDLYTNVDLVQYEVAPAHLPFCAAAPPVKAIEAAPVPSLAMRTAAFAAPAPSPREIAPTAQRRAISR